MFFKLVNYFDYYKLFHIYSVNKQFALIYQCYNIQRTKTLVRFSRISYFLAFVMLVNFSTCQGTMQTLLVCCSNLFASAKLYLFFVLAK